MIDFIRIIIIRKPFRPITISGQSVYDLIKCFVQLIGIAVNLCREEEMSQRHLGAKGGSTLEMPNVFQVVIFFLLLLRHLRQWPFDLV